MVKIELHSSEHFAKEGFQIESHEIRGPQGGDLKIKHSTREHRSHEMKTDKHQETQESWI